MVLSMFLNIENLVDVFKHLLNTSEGLKLVRSMGNDVKYLGNSLERKTRT